MSASREPVRVVVVGAGSFGRMHARTIAGLAEAELAGVVDPDDNAIAMLREDLPAMTAWAQLDQALEQSRAEAYVVATRTDLHVPLAEQILRAGHKVLLEKPIAPDAAMAARLGGLIAGDSSNLMAGHILLFAPAVRRLLNEAQRRGKLRYIHAVRHRPATTAELFPEEDPIRLTMVHDLYLALALVGGAEPIRLSGKLHRTATGRFDLAVAQVQWPDNVCGSLTASFLLPPGMAPDGFDRLELFGEDWSARLSLNPQPLALWTERAEWPLGLDIIDDPASPTGWLAEELRHFCRVVRGKAAVPIGARFADALRVQQWIERLKRSAAEEV